MQGCQNISVKQFLKKSLCIGFLLLSTTKYAYATVSTNSNSVPLLMVQVWELAFMDLIYDLGGKANIEPYKSMRNSLAANQDDPDQILLDRAMDRLRPYILSGKNKDFANCFEPLVLESNEAQIITTGCRIFVSRAYFEYLRGADSEEVLAFALAHEVQHALSGDIIFFFAYQAADLLPALPKLLRNKNQRPSPSLQRLRESRADRRAVDLMQQAGYPQSNYLISVEKLNFIYGENPASPLWDRAESPFHLTPRERCQALIDYLESNK